MRFANIFAGLAMAASAMAAATPQQIADGIKSITQKSQALEAPAQSITIVNAPLIIIGQGPFPQIIAGFADIVSTATALAAEIGASPSKRSEVEKVHARDISPRDANADLVFDAFRAFVRVHQDLLNILIGKAGLLTSVPIVGQPVAAALRGVEAIVDAIAITLINLFQARADDFQSEANALGNTLDLTIQKYNGLQV
ncbi:UVI-1 [Xylaria intraflava]|nr:UVI-1 [Xylaria intraflava]